MSAGASPQTPMGELTALPILLSWFQGGMEERTRGGGRERKGGMGKGGEKGEVEEDSALVVGDKRPWL